MTKEVTSAPIRPKVLAGAGAMLAVALGGFALAAPIGASASTEAAMLATDDRTITDAVAAAEAEHAAAVAAAEAAAAAAAAAEAQRAAAEAERVAAEQAAAAEAARAASRLQSVADVARAQAGDAYRLGASGPNVFDCSGLVMWSHAQALGVSLPHNTHAQWNAIADTWYAGQKQPQPGDVVFFFNNGADHVGIYLGDGMMVSAENPRSGVKVAPIYEGYWANKLTGFGRV